MSLHSSAEFDGRHGGRCGWVQCPTMRRRCQRNSVSTCRPATRLGSGRASAGRDRSEQAPVGVCELGSVDFTAGTPIWWSNTMISRSFERPERTRELSQ